MANKYYNGKFNMPKTSDKGNGQGGKGSVKEITKTYGDSPKFNGTEYLSETEKIEKIGGKGKFGSL